ncbi:MAG: hydroxymethylbilane synthase [Planctomycetaceae bacterium]
MNAPKIRIATRASSLALWQANHVADLLRAAASGREVELVTVTTTGDQVTGKRLTEFGGVGVFTREVQQAVLDGRADLAVHSLKDLPTETVAGLTLGAVPERAAVYDVIVLPPGRAGNASLDTLPKEARIGTGSLRRRAQLLFHRPDLCMLDIRGNLDTRLKKLAAGEFDAIVLAEAGLTRLNLRDWIAGTLAPPVVYPAVGQGALGIECRDDDAVTRALLEQITHADAFAEVKAERRLLADLRAGCHAPVGVATSIDGTALSLEAVVLNTTGTERIVAQAVGSTDQAEAVGSAVATELRKLGAERLMGPSSGN